MAPGTPEAFPTRLEPLAWSDLSRAEPMQFRLSQPADPASRADPWATLWDDRQSLEAKLSARAGAALGGN